MDLQQERVVSLIEFAQQSARLRSNPAATLAQHGLPVLLEENLRGLPGITLNASKTEDDEVWLVLERRHETKPPPIKSPILSPWIEMNQGPNEVPILKTTTDGASLIAAGTHRSSLKTKTTEDEHKPAVDPRQFLTLEEYEGCEAVRAHFTTYVDTLWRPWSQAEKLNRRSIKLYSQFFTLKQQLEGVIVEAQLELVWGVGIGVWNCAGTIVSYPLLTRLVELSLNPETAAIEIRPRDVDVRLDVDWYIATNNPGIADLEKAARDFFGRATATFSPFDGGTYDGLLRSAVAFLDSKGVYWPDVVAREDRSVPNAEQHLKVTDTWVLFARPRTNNLFLQDLEKLKTSIESTKDSKVLPPAVSAIVTEPDTENAIVELPIFRGVSASYHLESSDAPGQASSRPTQDLFFPKPFNDEQVRIIQLLEVSDGVTVQGPPGTGKTHTIANVICHYLAQGKRVLVTSMKDPALGVLQAQLPQEIRPLAISLLISEQDGMKQFEHAIHKIASEVQSLDRRETGRSIKHLEDTIDALHARLASVDRKISDWAERNIARIQLDGEVIDPQDAAREVVSNREQFEWIPDALGIGPQFAPQFGDAEVVTLRQARRLLGRDIDYLGASLPQLVEFPDSKTLLQTHQDLAQFEALRVAVEAGDVPPLADSGQETLASAQQLLGHIETVKDLRERLATAQRDWSGAIRERLKHGADDDLLALLESLGSELEAALRARSAFIKVPVDVPAQLELDEEAVAAISNLACGKSAFGISGLFRSEKKRLLAAVRIVNRGPEDAEAWQHVGNYLDLLKRFRELAVRWNAIAGELKIGRVSGSVPEDGLAAAEEYAVYKLVQSLVTAELSLCEQSARVFPSWQFSRDVADRPERLSELERALHHHFTKNRLANVWATKEQFQKVLERKSGRVVDEIREFLAMVLGHPAVSDAEAQARWANLMTELARVLGLASHLSVVQHVCYQVASSGAPVYAEALSKPFQGHTDTLLPDTWRFAWRLKRLATHLDAVDAHDELKKLSKARVEIENDLARAYRDVVVKRTWLKLAENASPSIRAALQAYLSAVQKIGKGTGKRAVRYRQDARQAAAQANPAVPCWIMPHYRVSESLPAELGCFDLVIIDEASQSDLTALPALLRATKVLIVGDDKQVSPEGVGLEEEKVRGLMSRFLGNQVVTYRPQMSPERSIYDLFKVVFAKSSVMLKEHFRCVGPIIEYSKREFYNHELRPLRLPKTSERLDPPLVDVIIEDGYRSGDTNAGEVKFIVNEIGRIVADPSMRNRSIGVVSLLGEKQALATWERLAEAIGPEVMARHNIACGDARTFQGKERDIIFLSMVSAPNDVGAPLSRDSFAQRFNVAASRARDRMYLVRSVEVDDLSAADRLRRSLIAHFEAPFAQDEVRVEDLRHLCESPFEREMYDELVQRGYRVTPQVKVGQYRIDLVVEGHNDARVAVECDGDKYHGAEKWADDMHRQRALERAGWYFWRCFASTFVRRRQSVLEDLIQTLHTRGVDPIGALDAPRSVHTEQRRHTMTNEWAAT